MKNIFKKAKKQTKEEKETEKKMEACKKELAELLQEHNAEIYGEMVYTNTGISATPMLRIKEEAPARKEARQAIKEEMDKLNKK